MLKSIQLSDIHIQTIFRPFIENGELEMLVNKWPNTKLFSTSLYFEKEHFDYWSNIVYKKKNRRGEVLFAITSGEDFLVHTKEFYPNSVFRLLTGGIHLKEPVLDALSREVDEETGMKIVDSELISILFYNFIYQEKTIPFISYIFQITPDHLNPVVQDQDENIAEFKWIPFSQMKNIYLELLNLPQKWKNWGEMRSIPHKILNVHFEKLDNNKEA